MSNGFCRGVPTDLDVRRLMDHFRTLHQGQEIPYEEVAQILGITKGTHRWASITTAWRKRVLAEQHLVIGCDPGVGYVILDDPSKADMSARKLKSGIRSCRRSVRVGALVDHSRLTPEQIERATHTNRVATAILSTATEQTKRFQPQLPKKQLGARSGS